MGGEKPTGIVVLSVLYIIEGLIGIAMGAVMWGGSSALGFGLAKSLGAAIGAVVIIIGLIDFLIGYGLWTLKPWARMAAIIFAIIGLINFPIGTIISIIVLWYLFKPEIKEAFAKQ
ncbi:MAG: hypothetical protein J7J36_01905 [Thermoplasmata archaeon]|nr:hypothetical protein [Thermoplasmata archaeon]